MSVLTHGINVHNIIDIAEQICCVVKHPEDGLNVDSIKHFSKFMVIQYIVHLDDQSRYVGIQLCNTTMMVISFVLHSSIVL